MSTFSLFRDAYHSRRIIRYLHAEWGADLAALSKATVSFHEPQEYFRVEKDLAGEARTPLMAAAANGSPSKFRFLVEMGNTFSLADSINKVCWAF